MRFVIDTAAQRRANDATERGTLVVNAIGSLLLGVITGLALGGHLPESVETIVGVGFCGALTTFSTFAFETVRLLEEGAVEDAVRNIALNTTVAFGLAAVGYAIVLSAT